MSRTPSRSNSSDQMETAVPTLRVMRLQSPELHTPTAGGLGSQSLLQSSLCLPDSLGVFVGESFTAYLGILNASKQIPIRRLTVSAVLQSPSQRWNLRSQLENGIDVAPGSGIDSIVSHAIEEAGQHILRVEVGYLTAEGGSKTFRKFYRFQVVDPFQVSELTVRSGDSSCFVSLSVKYNQAEKAGALVISAADFLPAEGLSAERIGRGNPVKYESPETQTATQLLDSSGLIQPGAVVRYLFEVKATSQEAILRGIAAGELLGKVVFTWRKSMGETGRIASSPIYCPAVKPTFGDDDDAEGGGFVVNRSGLSVDVAAAAASRARNPADRNALITKLPVTVEPIDPPAKLSLNRPNEVQFLVVNHSEHPMTLQLQFRLSQMTGLAVCGTSFKNLGEVPPNGGSTVAAVRFLPLAAGLLRVQGCSVVDLASGREMPQPPLFHVFVEKTSIQ